MSEWSAADFAEAFVERLAICAQDEPEAVAKAEAWKTVAALWEDAGRRPRWGEVEQAVNRASERP